MRLSKYYLPTLKEAPSDASITSHKYSLRAGLIKQNSSGIYTWLPLGTKVLLNLQTIIRQEMEKIDCLELIMPCVQSADLWKKSGRYDSYGDEMLRIKDRHQCDMLFSPTNEEMITDIVRHNIKSYKNLPRCFYQMQWKFRDEIRPRFGVMRGREFLMKDAYSFDLNEEMHLLTYEKIYNSYIKIFQRMSLKPIAIKAETGPIGGDLSHEFHIFANTGESTVYYDSILEEKDSVFNELSDIYTAADDLHNPITCSVPPERLKVSKSIEVGHIFSFGTKYSSLMDARVADQNGNLIEMYMGSYGIGISRLIAAIIEANHDDKGIIWPDAVSPFKISLINLSPDSKDLAEKIYCSFDRELLYDDTDNSAGVKFSQMDLIGIPLQIIIGKKSKKNNMVEIKNRKKQTIKSVSIDNVYQFVKDYLSNCAAD